MAAVSETNEASMTLRFAGHLLSAAIVVVTIVVGLYVARLYYVYPRTDDAFVPANSLGIAPHVSGPITALPMAHTHPATTTYPPFVSHPRPYPSPLHPP